MLLKNHHRHRNSSHQACNSYFLHGNKGLKVKALLPPEVLSSAFHQKALPYCIDAFFLFQAPRTTRLGDPFGQ